MSTPLDKKPDRFAAKPRAGKAPKRKSKFRRTLFAALIGALLAVVAYLLINQGFLPVTPAPGEEGQEGDVSAAGFDFVSDERNRIILRIKPTFIVNLAGLEGKYLMRVQVRLEVDKRAVAQELNSEPAKYHRLVDEILTIIKSRSYAELAFDDGIEKLKGELRDRLNRYISSGRIIRVLFHELLFDRTPDYPAGS